MSRKPLKYNTVGYKRHKLTCIEEVIKVVKNKEVHYCRCQCDCGNIKDIIRQNFVCGQTKSCGCARNLFIRYAQKRSCESRKLPGMEKAKKELWNYYRGNAKRRDYEFTLTEEQFFKLTKENCHYCGIAPFREQKEVRSKVYQFYEVYIYNGLDRVDNSKGYTLDNSVAACTDCNRAKRMMSVTEFKQWLERIYAHFCKK